MFRGETWILYTWYFLNSISIRSETYVLSTWYDGAYLYIRGEIYTLYMVLLEWHGTL